MIGWSVVRWTGVLGLAGIVLQLVGFVFFFAGGTFPSFDDPAKVLAYVRAAHFALTTGLLLSLIGFALLLGFNAGLRTLAVAAAAGHEWLATATLAAGIATIVMGFADFGLALAGIAIAASNHADAALIRVLIETSGVFAGAPFLIPTAFYLGAAGSLVANTGILPRWLSLMGWIGSVLVLIAAFSAYGGSDLHALWSANGIVTALALLPLYVWTLGAAVVFLWRKEGAAR